MRMIVHLLLVVLVGGVTLAWAAVRGARALHLLQLDSYANDRFWQWLAADPWRRLSNGRQAFAMSSSSPWRSCSRRAFSAPPPPDGVGGLPGGFARLYPIQSREAKETSGLHRPCRAHVRDRSDPLGYCHGGEYLVCPPGLSPMSSPELTYQATLVLLLASALVIQLSPLTMMLANILLSPVQSAINRKYLRQAQRRLSDVRPLVIGITGSYGKTSTKYLLERLLADHRRVLKTP